MNNDIEIIRSQDFSHSYATDVEHVVELYQVAVKEGSKKILELGSHQGISTVALALAAKQNNGFVCSVDLCDEIPNEQRVLYWASLNPDLNRYIFPYKDDAMAYLSDTSNPKYDFIFHDAAHGDQVLPQYYKAWSLLKEGVFCCHDYEQISDRRKFYETLQPKRSSITEDNKGRQLAFFYK